MKKRCLSVFLLLIAPAALTAFWALTPASALDLDTYSVTCSQPGSSEFWERAWICPSGDGQWKRPAYQFGSSISQTCNAGLAGMVQWTGTSFQGCDGTSWIEFGANEGPEFLATNTKVSSTASLSTKDATCTTEFGSNYQAANKIDVSLYVHAVNSGGTLVVAGLNYYLSPTLDADGATTFTTGTGSGYVACIRKTASVLTARTKAAYNTTDATKDAACSTDYGSKYQAANGAILGAYTKSHADTYVVVRGDSYGRTSETATGGIYYGSVSGGNEVLCVRKGY